MNDNLKRFLENVAAGFSSSPHYAEFRNIEKTIDDSVAEAIKEVANNLSGDFIQRLVDELEHRGLAPDGHKIVTGFSNDSNEN